MRRESGRRNQLLTVWAGRNHDSRLCPLTLTLSASIHKPRIKFGNYLPQPLYAESLALELEGIVAKRADAPYPAGRTSDWIKIKTPIGRDREKARWER
jgi:hypothetical protein